MLINFYRKTIEVVTQWFELTGTIIYSDRHPVRIRIKNPGEYQQNDAQKNLRASKYKR
jgi:hypothetical protein